MPSPGKGTRSGVERADPGVSNSPESAASGFESHVWHSVNQVFERLGKIDQKLDQIAGDHRELKASVEKHDKMLMRAIWTVGGIVLVCMAAWFIYSNFLKGQYELRPTKPAESSAQPSAQ